MGIVMLFWGFVLVQIDTINLTGIPDSLPIDVFKDFPSCYDICFTDDMIYLSYLYPNGKAFILRFTADGRFKSLFSSQGEAPEKYSFSIWDLKSKGDTLFIFSSHKVLAYTDKGEFLYSKIIRLGINIPEEIYWCHGKWIAFGESWDFIPEKGRYVSEECITEFDHSFKYLRSYFKPALSSRYLNCGLLTAHFIGDIGEGNLYLVNRPNPEIFVIDLDKGCLERKIRLRIPGLKKVRLAPRKKWKESGIMSDTNKFIDALIDWTNTFSFISSIVYNNGYLYLCYRDWENSKYTFYLVELNKDLKVLSKIVAPGNLIQAYKGNLVFAIAPNSILMCKVEE